MPSVQDTLPKSRITLTYRTIIDGEAETVNLPFRLLVMGNFSGRSGTDKVPTSLAQRRLQKLEPNGFDAVLGAMKIPLPSTPDLAEPIDSLDAFTPEGIARRSPAVKEAVARVRNAEVLTTSLKNLPALNAALAGFIESNAKEEKTEKPADPDQPDLKPITEKLGASTAPAQSGTLTGGTWASLGTFVDEAASLRASPVVAVQIGGKWKAVAVPDRQKVVENLGGVLGADGGVASGRGGEKGVTKGLLVWTSAPDTTLEVAGLPGAAPKPQDVWMTEPVGPGAVVSGLGDGLATDADVEFTIGDKKVKAGKGGSIGDLKKKLEDAEGVSSFVSSSADSLTIRLIFSAQPKVDKGTLKLTKTTAIFVPVQSDGAVKVGTASFAIAVGPPTGATAKIFTLLGNTVKDLTDVLASQTDAPMKDVKAFLAANSEEDNKILVINADKTELSINELPGIALPVQLPFHRISPYAIPVDKTYDESKVQLLEALRWFVRDVVLKKPPPRMTSVMCMVLDELKAATAQVNALINQALHEEKFKELEAVWRGLHELYLEVPPRSNVELFLLDATKEELRADFKDSEVDVSYGALFRKLYQEEYDQYGGRPFGAMIGLYEFDRTPADRAWLKTMAKVANGCHCPFISSVAPAFFGMEHFDEFDNTHDIEGVLAQPRYSGWDAFRDTGEAAYVGLTLPRYVLRLPWDPVENPGGVAYFKEDVLEREGDPVTGPVTGSKRDLYLWGNAAILFARNLVRSFVATGWCSHIRGVKGGGTVDGLDVHTFQLRDSEQLLDFRIPIEIALPDFKEYALSNAGFIPLIYKKNSGTATFFGAQSIRRAQRLKDKRLQEDSQLVCNLAYTFAITQIARYIKSIMRDNIGSTADAAYIKKVIETWLLDYVTTVSNPDQITTQRYPFKGAAVSVEPVSGEAGWYKCIVSVQPHIQFEGLKVELRLVSQLAG